MDENYTHLRWHRLSELRDAKGVCELMAATCVDGIGVIAEWVRIPAGWQVSAMDTEEPKWAEVTDFHEGEPVPKSPPESFDDLSK